MYKLSDILQELGVSFQRVGKKSSDAFLRIRPVSECERNDLTFISRDDQDILSVLERGEFGVILVGRKWGLEHLKEMSEFEISAFLVEEPRVTIASILRLIYPCDDYRTVGFHPSAEIHPEAKIHPSVCIGAHCVIGNCVIGENSDVRSFAVIKDNVIIGKNVVVREYCLIGGAGFGFVKDANGKLLRMPHIGRAVIEDDVELFPYVNVDRGALGETRVGKGTKIDHYSHVGHNCTIGENCIITAGSVLAGGSRVGARCWLGVGTIVKEKVVIGDDVTVGLGGVVIRNIEAGSTVVGVPAKRIGERRE